MSGLVGHQLKWPYSPLPKNDLSRRRLKKRWPELYRIYLQKLRYRRRPRILMGTDHLPILTFDFDYTIGRTYASLSPPVVVLDERELAALMV